MTRDFTGYPKRWVCTYINRDGMRTLLGPAQGRYTFATEGGAQDRLTAIVSNNPASTLASVYGDNPRFAVRETPCYPGHFDPVGIYFDEGGQ